MHKIREGEMKPNIAKTLGGSKVASPFPPYLLESMVGRHI